MTRNMSGGGTFSVEVPIIGVDLVKLPLLSFDYSIDPDVFVNLYLRVGTKFYGVSLTGHTDTIYDVTMLGGKEIESDGKWHTATINLRDMFLRSVPHAKSIVVEDAFIGNMDGRNYLVCGIGGNYAGAVYMLDNVRLYGPVASPTQAERTERQRKEERRRQRTGKRRCGHQAHEALTGAQGQATEDETDHRGGAGGQVSEQPGEKDQTPT